MLDAFAFTMTMIDGSYLRPVMMKCVRVGWCLVKWGCEAEANRGEDGCVEFRMIEMFGGEERGEGCEFKYGNAGRGMQGRRESENHRSLI